MEKKLSNKMCLLWQWIKNFKLIKISIFFIITFQGCKNLIFTVWAKTIEIFYLLHFIKILNYQKKSQKMINQVCNWINLINKVFYGRINCFTNWLIGLF